MNEGLNQFHAASAESLPKIPNDLELLKRQVDAGYRRVARKYGWTDVTYDDTRRLEIVKAAANRRRKAQKITL